MEASTHLAPRVIVGRPAAQSPSSAVVAPDVASWRAPAVPDDRPNGDDQVYAAAELVRLGLATRVTVVNAAVDPALPDSWEIRDTPVGLLRLPLDRTRVTAGPR